MPNLTEVISALNDVDRILELDDPETDFTATLEVLAPNGVWTPIEDGWFPERVDQRATGGKKFTRLSIADVDGARTQILASMKEARLNGREYKVVDKDAPLGSTREWIIEIQPK